MAEAAPYLHCWFAKLCTSKYYGAWSGRNLARTVHFILLYSTEIPGPSVFSLNVFSSWMLSSFCHIILHSRNLASGLCHVKGRPPCSCSKTSIMHFLTFSIPHQTGISSVILYLVSGLTLMHALQLISTQVGPTQNAMKMLLAEIRPADLVHEFINFSFKQLTFMP